MTTLYDVLRLVGESTPDDWTVVSTAFGPTYLYELGEVSTYKDGAEQRWTEINSHCYRATFRPDVSLGLAWGLSRPDDQRRFAWANFPDEDVHPGIVDILWNGSLIYRLSGVYVDGGRAFLPYPKLSGGEEWFDASDVLRIFDLVADIGDGNSEFGRYLQQTGLSVR